MIDEDLGVEQGIRKQFSTEEIEYTIDTTRWTTAPTVSAVTAYDESSNDADVTTTVFPTNTPGDSGATITLSVMKSLTAGKTYRVHVPFTDAGNNKFTCFFRVKCII